MEPFNTTDELYTCLTGERPIHVIASARSKVDAKDYPMAFVFDYGKGRVFHTVLGHDVRSITNSTVPELFRRGCAWAAKLQVRASDAKEASSNGTGMQAAIEQASGQFLISENGQPVLRYNYQTIAPGDILKDVQPSNLIYAKARSNYIHPLYGLNGQELTRDWSLDHPHHRGIYWAWPEVDYRGERGDLHALQRVFARPTGKYSLTHGAAFAQITAENLWRWDDREPIVREQTVIRAYRADRRGRCIDLEFKFTALDEEVAIARRGTDQYGGCLNIRFADVKNQRMTTFTAATGKPKMAWADLSGTFGEGAPVAGVTILQAPDNPQYPGDWVNFPDLNWLQPTFPAAKARWHLRKDEPLSLRFRLWIHPGETPSDAAFADQWRAYLKTL